MIRPERKSDISPLKSTHPHVEDGRMRNAFIILSIPATKKNAPSAIVSVNIPVSGYASRSMPDAK
jgi:hypothetical protein